MSESLPVKTYRVVAFRTDGTIGFTQEQLSKDTAAAVQEQLLTSFPKVLMQDERLSINQDGPIPDWSFESN